MSMAETPKKLTKQTPRKHLNSPKTPIPKTPQTLTSPRRSTRFISSPIQSKQSPKNSSNRKTKQIVKSLKNEFVTDEVFSPVSPDRTESKKRKNRSEKVDNTVKVRATRNVSKPKRRVYYKKVSYDGGEFAIADDVYVKRREDASSDNDDPEIEECRVCFKAGRAVMIECDDCLGGFHLKCLKPPLRTVPDGDWICGYCEGKKLGKMVELPTAPRGKERRRTAKEKLLSSDLWAVRIESLWKEVDGSFWFRGRWYIIPEETAAGRQPHNLKRELYRTNDIADNEMETVLRHCYVMTPNEYAKAVNEGDDVFLCEYEYDVKYHSFKRIAEIDNNEEPMKQWTLKITAYADRLLEDLDDLDWPESIKEM